MSLSGLTVKLLKKINEVEMLIEQLKFDILSTESAEISLKSVRFLRYFSLHSDTALIDEIPLCHKDKVGPSFDSGY